MSIGYLLDTSVISLFAPDRQNATADFIAWSERNVFRLFISVVTMVELEQGIHKLKRLNQFERARRFSEWREELAQQFGDRQLPVEQSVGLAAGALSDAAAAIGRHPGLPDILIAATAQIHHLQLLTRNLKHFLPLKIDAIDPLVTLPR